MKTLSILAILAATLSCGNSGDNNTNGDRQETSGTVTSENEILEEVVEEQETMLTGRVTREDLLEEPYQEWFNQVYESYEPSEEALETIDNYIHDYEIEVFMGTWCADSQREVPKLFKLLELTDYDLDKLEVIAVDTNKVLPENVETATEFEMVPTIVFHKNGQEVNRFVEFSQESIEEDIAKIVSGKEYFNPYAE